MRNSIAFMLWIVTLYLVAVGAVIGVLSAQALLRG